jgi:glutaredoxin/glutathione-dependent peroxiredoxin
MNYDGGLDYATIVRSFNMISAGEKLPAATLYESVGYDDGKNCPMPPQPVDMAAAAAGRKIVIFGLPGAYTPTCSAQHVPSYLKNLEAMKAKGVAEVYCMSVNDGFVMGAWGRSQGTDGKIRMVGDGSGAFTKALGLELDLVARGMGVRCDRFAMIVENGVVTHIAKEAPGKFEVSSGDAILAKL